jgi:endonuclease III
MPPTPNKQRALTQLFSVLPKLTDEREAGNSKSETKPVLEQFIYAVLREGTTRDRADRAYRNLHEIFFDWNEIRVSSVREISDALCELSGAEARAQRIISILQYLFETTFSFDLEGLHKKGVKEAAKKLARFEGANDYCVSWVLQQSLGGHALPLDDPTLRVVQRLGLIEPDQADLESIRSGLEHLVPKAKGTAFTDLASTLAEEYCLVREPQCSRCPLTSSCPKMLQAPRITTSTLAPALVALKSG